MALAVAQEDPSVDLKETNNVTQIQHTLTVSSGSLLVATGGFYDGTGADSGNVTISDSVNGSWSTPTIEGDGAQNVVFLGYIENAGSGSTTVTIDVPTGSYGETVLLEITGAATSGALDQTGTNQNGGFAEPTASTSAATDSGSVIAVAVAATSDNKTWTVPTNYTNVGNAPTYDRCCSSVDYRIFTGGSVETVTWTGSITNGIAAIATFKVDAGGGGGSAPLFSRHLQNLMSN